MKRFTYILLLISFAYGVYARTAAQQQTLKIVTRVVEKEYRFTNEFLLEINAEKADIDIKVVNGNTVKVYLEQSAMNADVRVAERELSYIHFVEKKERNRLYIHNYAQLKASTTGLASIVNNKYTIEVPRHCHLRIKNELGDVIINGVSTTMRYNLEYCGLTINDAKGKLYVDSRIGDVTLNDCLLDAEFITENVNLKLQRIGGSFDVQAKFGNLSCLMSEQVSLINANLEQCEATLINRTNIDFSYAIDANKGQLSVLDEDLKVAIVVDTNKQSLHRKSEDSSGTIIIKSEYGDINLY